MVANDEYVRCKTDMICSLAAIANPLPGQAKHRSAVPKDNRMVRVGDMLVAARVVSSAEITEAIQVSKRLNIPIGRVLITSGCVTEKLLHAALDLQSLVRDGEVPLESALKALSRIEKTNCTVKEALEVLNFRPKYGKGKNNLADLLVDSNLVSQEQIDDALKTSFEYGTPLGSTLVFQGALSPDFFPAISAIQEKVTNGKLSNEEAITELKEAFTLWLKAGDRTNQPALKTIEELDFDFESDVSLRESPAAHKKRHSEPKVLSNPPAQDKQVEQEARKEQGEIEDQVEREGQVAQEEIANALEELSRSGTSWDDVDASAEVSPDVSTAMESQISESESQTSEPKQQANASDANENEKRDRRDTRTRHVTHTDKATAREKRMLQSKHNRPGGRLIDLLSAADLLDQDNLVAAYQVMLHDSHRSATFLVESGLISDELRRQAERCHNLVRRGRLSPEQAIRALKSTQEKEVTFREALSKEGVNQPAKLEKDWQTGVAAGVVGGFLAAFFSLIVTLVRLLKKR